MNIRTKTTEIVTGMTEISSPIIVEKSHDSPMTDSEYLTVFFSGAAEGEPLETR